VALEPAHGMGLPDGDDGCGPVVQEDLLKRGREVRIRGHARQGGMIVTWGGVGSIAKENNGFVVGYVCWRHMTTPDGAWVWFSFAADNNVRTLGGAWGRAP
jgi:hypothetical protein